MNYRKVYLPLLAMLMAVCAVGVAWSAPIDAARARTIASGYVSSPVPAAMSSRHAAPGVPAPFHVFNAANQRGFVIVAGDDRVPAVLAHSNHGIFDASQMPPAMQALLDGYAEQMAALDSGARPARLTPRSAVAPLLTSHWGQGSPFNINLPWVSGNRAVTGCVATAMAQIMHYHQWPARPTTTIPSYTTSTNAIFMLKLEPVDFDWEAMHDMYYTNDTTSVSARAVATLMQYCDQALSMDFLKTTSNASTALIPFALATYFGYKATAHYVSRLGYSTADWEQMLHDELTAGRPVAYAGNKSSGGHSFVCDGCDDQGRFHINWGWNSQSDGYFVLSVLNPSAQGIGSTAGAYGYIYNQAMAIGLEPGTEQAGEPIMTSTRLTLGEVSTTRSYNSGNFTARVSNRFFNYTSQVASFDFGWGFFDADGKLLDKLYTSYVTNLKVGNYVSTNSRILSFGANRTSGTYYIKPICSVRDANNWQLCIGADESYIKVVINANRCTITGYGTAAESSYTVQDITFAGTLHQGKAVNVTATVTNNGPSRYDLIYLLVDGTFTSAAQPEMEPGETGEIHFRFVPTEAGRKTITLALNDDGTRQLASRTLTITPMDTAHLDATLRVLNVTDAENRIVTSNRFAVQATVTNTGMNAYDEDISVRLFRVTYGNYGTSIHTKSTHVQLQPGDSIDLSFDFDELSFGHRYFAWIYYFSGGELVSARGTSIYTVLQPEEEPILLGDINGDGVVDVADVNAVVSLVLAGENAYDPRADIDGNQQIDVTDINALINIILTQ